MDKSLKDKKFSICLTKKIKINKWETEKETIAENSNKLPPTENYTIGPKDRQNKSSF